MVYLNQYRLCNCGKCELEASCQYAYKQQRHPKESPGGLGLCPKLEENRKRRFDPIIKRISETGLREMLAKWQDGEAIPAEKWLCGIDERGWTAVDNSTGDFLIESFQDEFLAVCYLAGCPQDSGYFEDYLDLVEEATP